ncbi:MAG: TolC family protein [Rikenellaceae bacterium]
MKKILSISLMLIASISLYAQDNLKTVLESIEENNTTLKAMREGVKAQKLENRTGIFLPSPEFEFNYLWGSPTIIGNRNDIGVKQTLDIPTIAGMKSRVANGQNELVELQYKADCINILLQAQQYCIDLIYNNALLRELSLREEYANKIEVLYGDRLNSGDANMLEYNKIKLNLLSLKGEISRVDVERTALLSELKRLNGGVEVSLGDYQYHEITIPNNFDDWFASVADKSPVLGYVKQEVEVSKKQVTLSKGYGLPTLSAGYMREKVVGQEYQGVSFGISIPLWENTNRVKQAKAALLAAESRAEDSRLQFYGQLENLYHKTCGLKTIALGYRSALKDVNSDTLLKKALEAGEISLLEYMMEIGLYYDTVNSALEAERDFQKSFAELSSVEVR